MSESETARQRDLAANIGHGKFAKTAQGSADTGAMYHHQRLRLLTNNGLQLICTRGQAGSRTGRQADSRREAAGRSRGCRGAGTGTGTGTGTGVSCVKQMQMFAQPWWAMAMATSKTEAKAKVEARARATPAQRVRSGQAQLFKVEKLQRGQAERQTQTLQLCPLLSLHPATPQLTSAAAAASLWQHLCGSCSSSLAAAH